MNRTFTMLITILFPVFLMAQGEFPVTVTGDMKIVGDMKSVGEVYLSSGNTQNAAVENNGSLVLPSGIIFRSNDQTDGLLMNKGTITAPSDPGLVKVSKKFETFKWYYVSFPFDVLISSITDAEGNALTLDTDFYVNFYDIENRALQGTWNANGKPISHWKDITNPATVLKKGTGYQIAYDSDEHPDGLEMVFPAQNAADVAKLFSTSNTDKELSLAYFTGTNTDIAITSWGLNFIGPLATTNFLMSSDNLGGYIGWIQYWDNIQKNYIDVDIEDPGSYKTLPPYTSFFTQTAGTGEKITYTQSGLRLETAETGLRSVLTDNADIFTLSISGNNYSDRVKVYSGNSYDKDLNSKEDVIKFLSPYKEVPKVWIKKGNESLLIDKAPYEDTKKFSLGVSVEIPGDYVFSPENIYEGQYQQIWLTDQVANQRVDLLSQKYRFQVSSAFTSNDRFSLEMILAPTGINGPESDKINIYLSNSVLCVEGCNEGDIISIYNTTGQMIGNHTAGGNSFSQTLNAQGTLIVKVSGSSSSKITKIINK